MEIERLSFLVNPKDRVDDFIAADTAVWEPWLQQQRGYLRKQYQYTGNTLYIFQSPGSSSGGGGHPYL